MSAPFMLQRLPRLADEKRRKEIPTLTMGGPKPSLSPIVSMYFFKSESRNSKTR